MNLISKLSEFCSFKYEWKSETQIVTTNLIWISSFVAWIVYGLIWFGKTLVCTRKARDQSYEATHIGNPNQTLMSDLHFQIRQKHFLSVVKQIGSVYSETQITEFEFMRSWWNSSFSQFIYISLVYLFQVISCNKQILSPHGR